MEIEKKYWKISEIAKELGIATSAIRHYEQEIPELKPKKRYSNGWRMYSKKERDLVHKAYNLVKIEEYKISRARKILFGGLALV